MYNDEHAIAEIDTLTSTNIGNRPKTPDKGLQNKTNKSYHLGKLLEMWQIWPMGKFGQSTKECKNNTLTANQGQTIVTTFKSTQNDQTNFQTIEPIRYPTAVSPTRLPILT